MEGGKTQSGDGLEQQTFHPRMLSEGMRFQFNLLDIRFEIEFKRRFVEKFCEG